MFKKYRYKDDSLMAVQFLSENFPEIEKELNGNIFKKGSYFYINSISGLCVINEGDYIRKIDKDYYSKSDKFAFESLYELDKRSNENPMMDFNESDKKDFIVYAITFASGFLLSAIIAYLIGG